MPAGTPQNRVLELRKNSIVVYKKPKMMDDEQFTIFLKQAANDVLARFGISTIVVGVESWDEIMVLDEYDMAKYGWVKRDKVFLLKEDLDLTLFKPEELEELANWMTNSIESWKHDEEE